MSRGASRELVRKVVGYVVRDGRLLVFTHEDLPIEQAGIQVPAGSVELGEESREAAVREVLEETGLHTRVVQGLGVEHYDISPSRPELHERHFFQLESLDAELPERWEAGEPSPSGGGRGERWTCWWLPLQHGHVLCAGFGARLGALDLDRSRSL